jgi:hypothetical protein
MSCTGTLARNIECKARIDFHPDARAIEIVNRLRTRSVGGDASSIINRIIRDWSARQRRPTTG